MKIRFSTVASAALLSLFASAQFVNPGFEQSGIGWSTTHPPWTGTIPSDAPYGGYECMSVRTSSQNFEVTAYFYQPLPAAVPGDYIAVHFTCRQGIFEGIPPVTASAMIFPLAIDNLGNPTILEVYNAMVPMNGWMDTLVTFYMPSLPAGHTFGIGFGGHAFNGGDTYLHYDNAHVSIGGTGAQLRAAAWLDGCYVPAQGLMRDDLRTAGLIPTTNGNAGSLESWSHLPNAETIAPSVLTVTGPNAIVDWVRIELRIGSPENGMPQAMRNALIQRDGDIVDTDGVSPVTFAVKGGNYYVLLRHRNHLGVLSAGVLDLSTTPTVFDTRSLGTALFANTGAEAGPATKTVGSTRTLWAGNAWRIFQTGRHVQYTGNDNDRDMILQAIGGFIATNTITAYHRADINMDGIVKYTGLNNDRDIVLQTIGGIVSTNVRYEQVP
ncbi:MAG TPA: hypothetical protein PLE78_14165 [Flavobacteriales bacterium]|nr:hypothetical protein [Flavobacteriales bacterium]